MCILSLFSVRSVNLCLRSTAYHTVTHISLGMTLHLSCHACDMLAKPEEFEVRTGMQTQPHFMAQLCILTLYSETVNYMVLPVNISFNTGVE
jgi:hypothetical protein